MMTNYLHRCLKGITRNLSSALREMSEEVHLSCACGEKHLGSGMLSGMKVISVCFWKGLIYLLDTALVCVFGLCAIFL